MQQFITERRVDEDLGLERRFTADPDDLLPSIMKFGKSEIEINQNTLFACIFSLPCCSCWC